METHQNRALGIKCVSIFMLAVIMFFFVTTITRTLTRQILVKHYGWENQFTKAILFDVEKLDDGEHGGKVVDWETLYPFNEDAISSGRQDVNSRLFDRYSEKVKSMEEKVQVYVTDFLIGHNNLVGLANRYEKLIQWDYAPYSEYNGVVSLDDEYLCTYVEKKDISDAAANTISFAKQCEQEGIDFLYFQAPYKISEKQDKDISGILDFSNQNVNELIGSLKNAGVNVLDFREAINGTGVNKHSYFYKTDHHWLPETGLWAAQEILAYLEQQFGYNVDPSLLNQERFRKKVYPEWFLGSQGKKVTLSVVSPEDFSLLFPEYDTKLHFEFPEAGVGLDGDFSITYDMSQVKSRDFYDLYPYSAYMYGDHAFTRFENLLLDNDLRILCIHDSFGCCVLPFMALGVRNVDSLDIRHFTGSVQRFISENKPDAVIVLYNPSSFEGDVRMHTNTFDFR